MMKNLGAENPCSTGILTRGGGGKMSQFYKGTRVRF